MTNSPKCLYPLKNPLAILVITLLVVNLAVHAPFLITDHLGEPDSARIVNDSIKATYNGAFQELEYSGYSSPLYSDVLRFFLKAGVISISDIPFWLAFVSLISSAVITIGMFVFVFRLTASVLTALGASLILQLIPVFWFSSLYGFSTIVALAFFMVSLVLFQSAVADRLSRHKYLLFFGALIMYVLAVMTKLDILFASAIYCLPVWRSDRSFKAKVIWIGCLALTSGFVFLLFDQYAGILSQETTSVWSKWDRYNSPMWPSHVGTFFSRKNFSIITRAVGILSLPTALMGVLLIGWRREWRSTIFWLALSGLPLVLYWGMKPGNSSRHNFFSSLFLCIALVLPLTMRAWRKWAWVGFLCVVCLINYFYYPPKSDNFPFSLSGRLLASTHLLRERAENQHATGETIARLPYEKVAVIEQVNMHPYARFEMLRSSQLSYVMHTVESGDRQTLEMQNENKNQLFLWLTNRQEISEIVALTEQGYFVVICGEKSAKELSPLTELQGKWVSLDQLE